MRRRLPPRYEGSHPSTMDKYTGIDNACLASAARRDRIRDASETLTDATCRGVVELADSIGLVFEDGTVVEVARVLDPRQSREVLGRLEALNAAARVTLDTIEGISRSAHEDNERIRHETLSGPLPARAPRKTVRIGITDEIDPAEFLPGYEPVGRTPRDRAGAKVELSDIWAEV